MKILVISDPHITVPPERYGGTERITSLLCEGLAAEGHEVRLLAKAGSRDYGGGVVAHVAPGASKVSRIWRKLRFQELSLRAGIWSDVIINAGRLDYLRSVAKLDRPLVHWFHNPVKQAEVDYVSRLKKDRYALVSVSRSQMLHARCDAPLVTVYNAVDTEFFRPAAVPRCDYAVFLGRLTPNKGVHLAIDVARRAGVPLKIAGNLPAEAGAAEYFDSVIKPRLGEGCEFVGEVDDAQKRELLQHARALLFPIKWMEPFGIVMAESLACGTPVVALRRGSVPEVIRSGENGFACDQVDEMVVALRDISQVSREACRLDAETRFSRRTFIVQTLEAVEAARRYRRPPRSRGAIDGHGAKSALIITDATLPVPPRLYGGAERIAAFLAQGLRERGWKIRLLAAPGSQDFGDGLWAHRKPGSGLLSRALRKLWFQVLVVRAMAGCDVVINFGRIDYLRVLFRRDVPLVLRFGNPVTQGEIDLINRYRAERSCCVFISGNQSEHLTRLGRHRIVYNGVDLDQFSPGDLPISERHYLLFLGRLTRNKGIDLAIEAARRSGQPLVIAGSLSDEAEEQQFFDREIRPKLNDHCRWVGPVDDYQKCELLRGAKALLFPIRWEEPFGIVMAESLACGTPVIATCRGSVPEVVTDGRTGFICDDLAGICDAIGQVDRLSAADCRAEAIRRFSREPYLEGMLDAFEKAGVSDIRR
jgi:glycosyltransferase involved in cell wall biosynthesis